MGIDRDAVRRVIDLLAESQAAEIEIEDDDMLIRVARQPDAPDAVPAEAPETAVEAPEPAPPPVESEEAAPEPVADLEYVTAGLVGLFHRGRAPDDEPIVSVGDEVVAGQVIGTIEALRKLTDVVAPSDGVIEDILVDDGESVQFGDELFAIRSEE